MPHGDMPSHDELGPAGRDVTYAPILDVGIGTDRYLPDVAPDDGSVPHTRAISDRHITYHESIWRDVHVFTDDWSSILELLDHGTSPVLLQIQIPEVSRVQVLQPLLDIVITFGADMQVSFVAIE